MSTAEHPTAFADLLDYIKSSRGFDFTGYKRPSLERRVHKRMQMVEVEHCSDYLDYLEVHPEEFTLLFNTILINVTAFFRDASAWDYLASDIIPAILANKPANAPIRVWSAGCASGEEAYTLAMVLAEIMGLESFRQRVKIYATDVDEEALAEARQALYSAKSLQAVPAALQEKYFELIGTRYAFRPDLRRTVIFGRHDLIQDSPISRLDLLVCRNTLMYLNAEIQARILARFHFALHDQGTLFLGRAEMLLTHAALFTPTNLRHRIFARVPKIELRDRLLALSQADNDGLNNRLARQVRLRDESFETAPMAQIVVDTNRILVMANVQARALFDLGADDLGRPFHELACAHRPIDLRALVEQVMTTQSALTQRDVAWSDVAPDLHYVDLHVVPLLNNGGNLLGVNIAGIEVTRIHLLQAEIDKHRQDLETAYEELQSTNEELETTNEELQSTVEELETTNEELQSTNEEMETMNEELQSTNTELQTINEELQLRTDEINRANAFQEAILTSLRSAVVVVDRTLRITMWSEKTTDLWGLRAEEVQDQFLLNLDIGLPIEQLKGSMGALLEGETVSQEMTLPAINRRGRPISCHIIGTVLRDIGGQIDGVILTMEEVTA